MPDNLRSISLRIFYSFTILLLAHFPVFSQGVNSNYPDSLVKPKLYTAIATEAVTFAAGYSFLQYIWYKDHERTPMHFYNDFKGYLQMDKGGHAFTAYRQSHGGYYALRNAGVPKKKALLYGGTLGLVFQTPIEIFDGLYEGYGFSWPDMGANTFGTLLFMGQEIAFDEQVVLLKFSYTPSEHPKYHNYFGDTHFDNFFRDYNAHTYWLSANLKKITGIDNMPPWLNIAYGYSANGLFGEFENPTYYKGQPIPHWERYRQHLLSLDIDFTRIKTNKKFLRTVFNTLNLVKIPFPAIEYNRIDGLKFRALYF